VFPKLGVNESTLHRDRDARPSRRYARAALGREHSGALHRDDRQQAQDHRVVKELEKEGIPRSAFERVSRRWDWKSARFRRRRSPSRWRGDDCDAARSGRELALAVEVDLRRRPSARAAEVNTAGIILAAGESRRMGRPKAFLPFRGGTFLSASGCDSRDQSRIPARHAHVFAGGIAGAGP
jgi:hypothetical protein